jgi:hypothetical protein
MVADYANMATSLVDMMLTDMDKFANMLASFVSTWRT